MASDDSVSVPSDGEIVLNPDKSDLFLRIPIAALTSKNAGTTFRLTCKDDPDYDVTMTLEDDMVPNDDFADLLFPDVLTRGRFTLEINPGGGKPKYFAFKDKSMLDLAGMPAGGQSAAPFAPASSDTDSASSAPAAGENQSLHRKEAYE